MRLIDVDAPVKEIRRLKEKASTFGHPDYKLGYISALSCVEGMIASAPTIDAVPVRHGRYGFVGPHIGSTCSPYAEHGTCIECKERILIDPYHKNYCPSCGAKMDLEVQ